MKKSIETVLSLSLLVSIVFSGCWKNTETALNKENARISLTTPWPWEDDKVTDASDVPSYSGGVLTIKTWETSGTVSSKKIGTNDVVTPEIERVTGVKVDAENCIDNGGQSFEAKLGMLLAGNDLPDIVAGGDTAKLVQANLLYDLTELLPKYAPSIYKKYPKNVFGQTIITGSKEGKIFAVPFSASGSVCDFDTTVDPKAYSVYNPPADSMGYVWVRDDIVKTLYPSAKTQNEIEKMYLDKGLFTKQDILDVPVNSYDDFMKMLYDIKALNLRENNKPVYATYAKSGTDNFGLMNELWRILNGCYNNYMFTYWDKKVQKMQYTINQDFFQDSLKKWNKLVLDGVVSKESFLDTVDLLQEKINTGQYAVIYGVNLPDDEALKKAGKAFRYRKVYLNIPPKADRFINWKPEQTGTNSIAILKNKRTEKEVIQLLRWLDFQLSDVGEKLICWGPRSAGLWKDNGGKREFINKEIEQYMINNENLDIGIKYNLRNGLDITAHYGQGLPFMWNYAGKFQPLISYKRERNAKETSTYFSMGQIVPDQGTKFNFAPIMWTFEDEAVKKVWATRPAIEVALTRVIASKDEAEYKRQITMLNVALEANGWDDEMLKKAEAEFTRKNSKLLDRLK